MQTWYNELERKRRTTRRDFYWVVALFPFAQNRSSNVVILHSPRQYGFLAFPERVKQKDLSLSRYFVILFFFLQQPLSCCHRIPWKRSFCLFVSSRHCHCACCYAAEDSLRHFSCDALSNWNAKGSAAVLFCFKFKQKGRAWHCLDVFFCCYSGTKKKPINSSD